MNRRDFLRVLGAVAVAPLLGQSAASVTANNVEPNGFAVGNDLANGEISFAIIGEPFVRGELHVPVFVAEEVRTVGEPMYIGADGIEIVTTGAVGL